MMGAIADATLARIEAAADKAVRSFFASGAYPPPHIERRDLQQAAREAAVSALAKMDDAYGDQQQAAYLARRALGGIQDLCRARRRDAGRREHVSLDAMREDAAQHSAARASSRSADRKNDLLEPWHLDTPEHLAMVSQACEAIAQLPGHLPMIVRLTLTGGTSKEIADVLGLSSGRITQLRGELARRLNRYLTVGA